MILIGENTKCVYFLITLFALQFLGYTVADGEEETTCVVCNSDEECNINECVKCENSGKCFTKIHSNGTISRGCLAANDTSCTEENNCLSTDSCKNKQIVCIKCEASDEACSQTDMNVTNNKNKQFCDKEMNKCFVKVENRRVVRGCATHSIYSQCTNEATCRTCDQDNCNTGIFPTKRIQCYQCSDDKCADLNTKSLVARPCLNYEEKDECYMKGENEAKLIRGCKSDDKDNQCSSSTEGCLFCSSSKCNNLKYKRDQELKCHQCTGNDAKADCFKEQTSQEFTNCEKQLLYNETEYCYTHVDNDKIQRGCLYDNANLTLDNCKDDDNDVCIKCNQTNGCNNKAVSPEFTCIICRSDLDKRCWNNADTLKGEKCRTEGNSSDSGCFHGIWNGVAIRDCLIDASIQVQATCKDNSRQCRICHKRNCNIDKSSGAGKLSFIVGIQLITLTTALWNFQY